MAGRRMSVRCPGHKWVFLCVEHAPTASSSIQKGICCLGNLNMEGLSAKNSKKKKMKKEKSEPNRQKPKAKKKGDDVFLVVDILERRASRHRLVFSSLS